MTIILLLLSAVNRARKKFERYTRRTDGRILHNNFIPYSHK